MRSSPSRSSVGDGFGGQVDFRDMRVARHREALKSCCWLRLYIYIYTYTYKYRQPLVASPSLLLHVLECHGTFDVWQLQSTSVPRFDQRMFSRFHCDWSDWSAPEADPNATNW